MPKLPRAAEPSSKFWYTKVTPEEFAEGTEQAAACERSMSNYVRWLVKRDRKNLIEAGLVVDKPSRKR